MVNIYLSERTGFNIRLCDPTIPCVVTPPAENNVVRYAAVLLVNKLGRRA